MWIAIVLVVQFIIAILGSAYLFKKHLRNTWSVVLGVALTLLGPTLLVLAGQLAEPLTIAILFWAAFVVTGLPVIVWQLRFDPNNY